MCIRTWPHAALSKLLSDQLSAVSAIISRAAERALRAVALGRKNDLFAGSDAGGDRAAAVYSLIGSAKLNGLDPEAYRRDVLARIAELRHETSVRPRSRSTSPPETGVRLTPQVDT